MSDQVEHWDQAPATEVEMKEHCFLWVTAGTQVTVQVVCEYLDQKVARFKQYTDLHRRGSDSAAS
jgi:hypothetical protein